MPIQVTQRARFWSKEEDGVAEEAGWKQWEHTDGLYRSASSHGAQT